jgi:orotidine-5'-phosphate decarboxylase
MDRGWLFNTSESIAANASVFGITIVNGHASGGAGMLFVSAAAAVRDVVFLYGVSDSSSGAIGSAQRSAGGGVSLYNSNATFNNVTFRCEDAVAAWTFTAV